MSLVIGLVSIVALDRFLMDRLDDQLATATNRSRVAVGDAPGPRRDRRDGRGDDHLRSPSFLLAPGQAEGTLGARVVPSGPSEAAVLDPAGEPRPLPAAQHAVLAGVPVDGRPHTRDLGGEYDDYRLVAVAAADGDVIITGLPLRGVRATVYRLAAVITLVALAGLLAAALVGAAIVRLALQPLRRVAATASRVAELPLDRGEVALAVRVPTGDTNPRTEVGQVGAALNRMLEHVAAALAARHHSESTVRQFVADASHELRTPLAAIRGYAELTRRSRAAAPPDVGHALQRIEAEAVRMTGLVEDLLLLARLDAGRPVEHACVDLSSLVADSVADARAAGPQHRWRLELPAVPVEVVGDGARLHQVVANLLANARTHTPQGTQVTVSLAAESAGSRRTAVLRVSDNGPGIPPDLVPLVFERFARGDTSRSRAAGSTGLGLAIVAAVVEAHGGTVDVSSVPGHTAFTVRLPQDPHRQRARP